MVTRDSHDREASPFFSASIFCGDAVSKLVCLSSSPFLQNTLSSMTTLRIKTPHRDLDLTTSATTVGALKDEIRQALAKPQHHSVRLIARGKLLEPDDSNWKDVVQDTTVVHAVVTAQRPQRQRIAEEDDIEQPPPPRGGFDSLRGLSRAETQALRTYFARHVDEWAQQTQPPLLPNEDPLERRNRLEEAWMETQGVGSEFRLNVNGSGASTTEWRSQSGASTSVGTDRDFVWGFFLGFFVGMLMMVWIWLPQVPHKQKLGILTGITVQLALGMLKASGGDEFQDAFE